MFVDEVKVTLKAGNGGKGCLSFRREKFIPMGGPNGGDGGDGGHIILHCNPHLNDLTPYRFQPNARAENGEYGKGSDQHGRNGKSCILQVPPGTLVYNDLTGDIVAELLEPHSEIILLRGGKGGTGNTSFKSSINQAPRKTTPGDPGEEGTFRFEMKTIADVGLVGFPNAGKSSLTSILTHAHPKIAPYPFTTLHPNVGVIEDPYRAKNQRPIFVADIPGLIKGAHENKGLGHKFLRHIERCHFLLILIDMSGIEERSPHDDYTILLNELTCYSPQLLDKPRLVIANKMDAPEAASHLADFKSKTPHIPIIQTSCTEGLGIDFLRAVITKVVGRRR